MSAYDLQDQLPCPCGADEMRTVARPLANLTLRGLECRACGLAGNKSDAWQLTVSNWNNAVKSERKAQDVAS